MSMHKKKNNITQTLIKTTNKNGDSGIIEKKKWTEFEKHNE
jgi:hypothetical protein